MKILALRAENFKRLTLVDINPDGTLVEITGKNGNGKSSVLDSFYAALCGKDAVPEQPIHRGATKGKVVVKLGNDDVELIVERRFTDKDSTVIVSAPSGARKTSPQSILDALISLRAFDPMGFLRDKAPQQLDTLKRLVPLSVNVDELDGLNKADFEARTDHNRDLRSLTAQAEGIPLAPNLPDTKIDTAALLTELEGIADFNSAIEREASRRKADLELITANLGVAERKRGEAAELRKQAAELDEAADRITAASTAEAEALEKLPDLAVPKDPVEVRKRLDAANLINGKIDNREQRRALESKALAAQRAAADLTAKIEARNKTKADAIAAAKMPIEGLSFGDGQVLFNGLPLTQAGTAEQIRVSMAIAMAANPQLRVVMIRDGSLVDEDGMKIIAEMAKASDYQVWCERVDSSGEVGIVIEDGHVKGQPAFAEEEKAEPAAPARKKVSDEAPPQSLI